MILVSCHTMNDSSNMSYHIYVHTYISQLKKALTYGPGSSPAPIVLATFSVFGMRIII